MRKAGKIFLHSFSRKLKDTDKISARSFIEFRSAMRKTRRTSQKISKKYFSEIQNDLELQIAAINCLAIRCLENKNQVVSKDFPASDLHLATFLINICNTAQAIINLCNDGFDTQARVLVRTLDERLSQISLLYSSNEDYAQWHSAEAENDSKSTHYSLFAKKGRLQKKYAELERTFLGEAISSNELTLWRKEQEEFYSMAVHGASNAVLIGSWAFDHDSDKAYPAVFGMSSSASISTLKHIRFSLCLFLIMFPKILQHFHQWIPNIENELERSFDGFLGAVIAGASEWYPSE